MLVLAVAEYMYFNSDASIRLARKFAIFEQFERMKHRSGKDKKKLMFEFRQTDHWKQYFECKNYLCPNKK